MDKAREDLLQRFIEGMMSVVKNVVRGPAPGGPALSPPQVRILHLIAGREEGVPVSELADKMRVTPGAVTQFVDALVAKDLISRESDPDDRRVVRLRLTGTAIAQYERLRKEFLASAARAFDVLTDEELHELIRLFSKVNDASGGKQK
jgi:DNA-binding MarR family transcriptional regulator